VAYFNSYSERELKQLSKLKAVLSEQALPNLELLFVVKGVSETSVKVQAEFLYDLLEFLMMHPHPKEAPQSKINLYLQMWLKRFSQ
jgi:hypothetical protein